MTQAIVVTIETKLVDEKTAKPIVDAIQIQVSRDFAPVWGVDALLLVNPPRVPPGAWKVRLMDHSDQAGDLGYHEDDSGNPEARIFVIDVEHYEASLSVVVSHEVLEMLADPLTARTYPLPNGRSAACEVCDPVEADDLGYEINGVQVSDFVYPAYFEPQTAGPYDHMRHLASGCPTLTAGGYQLIYDPKTGWDQDTGDHISMYRCMHDGRCEYRQRWP